MRSVRVVASCAICISFSGRVWRLEEHRQQLMHQLCPPPPATAHPNNGIPHIVMAQHEAEEAEIISRLMTQILVDYTCSSDNYLVDHCSVDGDGSDNASDDSDATVEQSKNKDLYVDVAKRPSAIKWDAKPGRFLTCTCPYGFIPDGNYEETVFDKAIREDDLESFVKVLNMFVNLPVAEDVPHDLNVEPRHKSSHYYEKRWFTMPQRLWIT